MHFNPYIYEKTAAADIKSPQIPSILSEQYGQQGEDVILLGMLKALARQGILDTSLDWRCVEIGGNHAFGGSTTYLVESQLRVLSVIVEANPDLISDLQKARPYAQLVNVAITPDARMDKVALYCANHNELSSLHRDFVEQWHGGEVGVSAVLEVPAMTPQSLFEAHVPNPDQLLFLSIDIEGADLCVAKAIDFSQWRPWFVQLEPSEHYNAGESDSMVTFMAEKGYRLTAETSVNLLFTDKRILKKLLESDTGFVPLKTSPDYGIESSLTNESAGMSQAQPQIVKSSEKSVTSGLMSCLDLAEILADWTLDEALIDQVMQGLDHDDVVSLDIFDTALTRFFNSPIDLFAEVERRLVALLGNEAAGFADARVQAEKDARRLKSPEREDVTLEEIYKCLVVYFASSKKVELAKEIELSVEEEELYAVPDILELTRRLFQGGYKYIFVSDMYLSSEFLSKCLSQAGYQHWDMLLVSSEVGRTKATGGIWSEVAKYYPLRKLVHVGDDKHSDVVQPRLHDIRSFEYYRARSERRLSKELTPAVLPFSLLHRTQELKSRKNLCTQQDKADKWYRLGRSMGTVVVGSFVKWLAERAQKQQIERLYFCARDGYLMQQAWEAAGFSDILSIEPRYVYISRATLNLSAAVVDSNFDELSSSLLTFLSSSLGDVTVKVALARAGLDTVPEILSDLSGHFGSLNIKLDSSEKIQAFEAGLQRHAGAVYEKLSQRYAESIAYLRQEGLLDDSRKAMVDMGWHATMQRSLSGLRAKEGQNRTNFMGFYYGLWPNANRNLYKAGVSEACFAQPFLPAEQQPEVHQAVAVLEELHGTRHGTTISYKKKNGGWEPIFMPNALEEEQHDTMTRWFQQGTVDGIRELFANGGEKLGLLSDNLSPQAGIAALGQVFLSPSTDELNLLSQIGHCPTFDHAEHQPLLTYEVPVNINKMRQQLYKSDWAAGQILYWWPHANENQKQSLRELLHTDFAHLGSILLQRLA